MEEAGNAMPESLGRAGCEGGKVSRGCPAVEEARSSGRPGPRAGGSPWSSKRMRWAAAAAGEMGGTENVWVLLILSPQSRGCLGAGSQVNCGVEDGCHVDL